MRKGSKKNKMPVKKKDIKDYFVAGILFKMSDDMTKLALAKKAGLSIGGVTDILNKKRGGRIETWAKLSKAVGYDSLWDCLNSGYRIFKVNEQHNS